MRSLGRARPAVLRVAFVLALMADADLPAVVPCSRSAAYRLLLAGMLKPPINVRKSSQSKAPPNLLLPFGALTVPLARVWFAR